MEFSRVCRVDFVCGFSSDNVVYRSISGRLRLAYSREWRSKRRPFVAGVEQHKQRVFRQRLEVLILVDFGAVFLENDVNVLFRWVVELFFP